MYTALPSSDVVSNVESRLAVTLKVAVASHAKLLDQPNGAKLEYVSMELTYVCSDGMLAYALLREPMLVALQPLPHTPRQH